MTFLVVLWTESRAEEFNWWVCEDYMWDFVGSEFSANPSHHLLLKTLLVSHCWLEGQSHLAQSVGSGLSCLFQLSWIPDCLSSSHRSCFPSKPLPQEGFQFSLPVALSSSLRFLRHAFWNIPTRTHFSFMLSRLVPLIALTTVADLHLCGWLFMKVFSLSVL